MQSHDLSLPAWGPYTKRYSGISHVPAANDGVRFDLSVFPGMYRRRVDVPNVRFESGFHPWAAAPDLSCYTFRHELLWKDQLYADISFAPLGEDARLIRAELHNNTDAPQNLVLHYMASAWDPVPSYRGFSLPGCEVSLPENAAFVWAKDYDTLDFSIHRPNECLTWDGLRRGEEAVPGFGQGYGIGMGFGCSEGKGPFGQVVPNGKGDTVTFTLSLTAPLHTPCLCVRYWNPADESSEYDVNGQDTLRLPPCQKPSIAILPLNASIPAGKFTLTLTAAGVGGAKLDCLALCEQADAGNFTATLRGDGSRPQAEPAADENYLTLQYPHIQECYGILWDDITTHIRTIENDELDIFLRDTVHDHVNATLRGNGKGHYVNLFMGPISLEAGQTKVIYGAVCAAPDASAAALRCHELLTQRSDWEHVWQQASASLAAPSALPAAESLALGQQLMNAVLCTNVVYPVYTRGQYIRHYTPGRWWDCVYTWDSGFIGMGLAQTSLRNAFDCLNTYLMPPDSVDAAFLHHGSMVPTQFYLYAELLNRTGSRKLAAYCYPRLKLYYRFFTGQEGGSTTANLHSGLLRPWDYFYNSGGWDDYPPQQEVQRRRLQANCAPVVTTAHAIRCANILAYTARLLSETADADAFDADALRLGRSLQTAWDEESGYFGYLLHDPSGDAADILRTEQGLNYDMGLDGASPLFAGACTEPQKELLWQKLQSPEHLWCACGLSTVDQSAPYYRRDGYWNGAVWMPYQWMFFKSALDAGLADFAYRIADTVLTLWQNECTESYCCFEHFMIESRRGAGWHQFSGLSSPIVQLFSAYYRPGTLTTGFDAFVRHTDWAPDNSALNATLDFTATGRSTVLAVLQPGSKAVTASVPCTVTTRHDGLLELTFALDAPCTVTISIHP